MAEIPKNVTIKFKAVWDEAAMPERVVRKDGSDSHNGSTVLASCGDGGDQDKLWVVDDDMPNEPYTTMRSYWNPAPEPTPDEAQTGDLWSYGQGGMVKYRVLGVDKKAGVWIIVNSQDFGEYKSREDFTIQYESSDIQIYVRALPDEAGTGKSLWRLVERP